MFGSLDAALLKKGVLITLALGTLVYALWFAPAATPSVDETIYHAAIERFAEGAHLNLQNGYLSFPSSTLRLIILIPTDKGLVPQYPAGFAVLAAPFFSIFGEQGVLFLNALAFVGLLAMTYQIGREFFDDLHLALNAALFLGLGTFSIEYAFTAFPHAFSAFIVACGAYFAVLSVKREKPAVTISFVGLAGLAIGLGINIRVDVILAAPAIAVWLIGSSRMALAKVTVFVLTLVPGLLIGGFLNFLKFGFFTPFTYGLELLPSQDTLASVSVYLSLLPLLPVGAAFAMGFAFPAFRNFILGLRGFIFSLITLAAILIMPYTSSISQQLIRGMYVLLIDLQSLDFIRQSGIHDIGGGKILFLGKVKKALFESMPYAGFILLPFAGLFQARDRGAYALCGLMALAWYAFYGVNQWHGGSGSNIRYFLPTLPFICILAACAWRELAPKWKINTQFQRWIVVIFLGFVIVLSALFIYEKAILPLFFLVGGGRFLFYIAAFLGVLWIVLPKLRSQLKRTMSIVYAACLMVAFWGAYFGDLYQAQAKRYAHQIKLRQVPYEFVEPNALVISLAISLFKFQLMRPDGLLARGLDAATSIDFKLIDWALNQGRPVYIQGAIRQEFERDPVSSAYVLKRVKNTLDAEMYTVSYSSKIIQ
jgi:hypothetical protein